MKKFLSLALALIMTMSLVTISAGAKDFSDNGEIAYGEAVGVVSALKIIDGYTDGSFKPAATLTRGAAAKIICNMILGPTTAAALSADAAPFSDVPADHVFAGYIAYCAQQGILNGYADGTFKPANTVTGYQFMKMLLGALGYDGSIEGYTGANWSINVAKQALALELEDGNDNFVGTKAMTREEACLYAFNTLKATMVEYGNKTQVIVGDVTVTTSAEAKEITRGEDEGDKYEDVAIIADNTLNFVEKYFAGKVSISDDADDQVDAFGRPATTWLDEDGEVIGTFADKADKKIVLNDSSKALAYVLTNADYLNLKEDDVVIESVALNGDESDEDIDLNAGDTIEVFKSNKKYTTVVVIRNEAAKIDEVETELTKSETKAGASAKITLENVNEEYTTTVDGEEYYDAHDDENVLKGYTAKTYKEDAVLSITANEDAEILASNVAEKVTGPISKIKTGDKAAITINGKAYPVVGAIQEQVADLQAGLVAQDIFDEDDFTLYLDANGYVIAVDGDVTVSLDDVYVVTAIGGEEDKYGNATVYVQAVALKDGKVVEFVMDTEDEDYEEPALAGLYSFDEGDNEGKYLATEYTTEDYTVKVDGTVEEGVAIDIAKDDTKYTVDGQKVYFQDDTSFIKIETNGKGDTTVKTTTGSASVAADGIIIAISEKSDAKTKDALYVIVISDEIENSASGDEIVYLKGNPDTKNADGWEGTVYYMDGTGKSETVTLKNKYTGKTVYTFSVDDDDIYKLTADVDALEDICKVNEESGKKEYDDETGYVAGAWLTSLTAKMKLSLTSADYEFVAEDVALASKVVIIDHRNADTRDESVYKTEVTTSAKLLTAIKKGEVQANVFLDDGEVILVAVTNIVENVEE